MLVLEINRILCEKCLDQLLHRLLGVEPDAFVNIEAVVREAQPRIARSPSASLTQRAIHARAASSSVIQHHPLLVGGAHRVPVKMSGGVPGGPVHGPHVHSIAPIAVRRGACEPGLCCV